jgi:SAM-dependent methyltransferase
MPAAHWIQRHKQQIKRFLSLIGYDHRLWARCVMYDRCFEMLRSLRPEALDVLEISAGPVWRELGFKSFTEANYPQFDICRDALERKFDLIIADQIFEHVLWPYRAARNVHAMLKPSGHFLITTPFLIRVHREPADCTRWTEAGLANFLSECGFSAADIRTDAWGNRACVKANFGKWARRGWFGSLRNEPDFPVAVWALAKKSPA